MRATGRLARFRRRRNSVPADADGAVDAFARAIDVRKLDEAQFVQLIDALNMLDEAKAGIAIESMETRTLVWLIDQASRAQLERMMAEQHLRVMMVEELFRRMSVHLDLERARSAEIVVCWRFPDGSGDGGYDRYQTVIAGGGCVSGQLLDRMPNATVTIAPADLLKLATGGISVPAMFLTGRIKVKGDLPLVARLTSYFDIPRP